MELSFTKASLSQHVAIDRLMRDAFTPYAKKLGRGPIADPYPWLEAAVGRGDIYVGLDETEIVGVVASSRRNDVRSLASLLSSWISGNPESTSHAR
jgi:hypothetical protein